MSSEGWHSLPWHKKKSNHGQDIESDISDVVAVLDQTNDTLVQVSLLWLLGATTRHSTHVPPEMQRRYR